jgi:non-heme chloroperoxidase
MESQHLSEAKWLPGSGVTLRADVYGPPADQTVLLLHGGGQTRHSWAEAAEKLAGSRRQAVAVDLRGHGDSSWADDGDYSLDAFASDIRCLVADLAVRPVVVGASLGGLAALLAVAEAPSLPCQALVLVDIAVDVEQDGAERIVSFMLSAPDGFATLEEAAEAIGAYRPGQERPRNLSGLAKNLRRAPDGRWRWHWDPQLLAGDQTPRTSRHPGRLEAAARAIDEPTLLVRGRQSDLLSARGAERFLAMAPHARLADVSDAGHMVVGDRNDVFVDAVLEFLDELARDESKTA